MHATRGVHGPVVEPLPEAAVDFGFGCVGVPTPKVLAHQLEPLLSQANRLSEAVGFHSVGYARGLRAQSAGSRLLWPGGAPARYVPQCRRVMLFARQGVKDRAFWFLGPATYVGHEGERPMAITWELTHPLPGDLYAQMAAAVA